MPGHGRGSVFRWLARYLAVQLLFMPDSGAAVEQQALLQRRQQCDGVHCDMAMLLLPDVFERTWGTGRVEADPDRERVRRRRRRRVARTPSSSSWPRSTGSSDGNPSSRGSISPTTRGSMTASCAGCRGLPGTPAAPSWDFRNKLVRFLENHDEPRAAAPISHTELRRAGPPLTTIWRPGLRFFHDGQLTAGRAQPPSGSPCQ